MSKVSPEAFRFFAELVRSDAAIVLEAGKEYLVETRLTPLVRLHKLESLDALASAVRGSKNLALHQQVIEAMTTNETSFFRDLHPFEALKNSVLPALGKAREINKKITIWCGASSSGQEPYTIAMIAREFLGARPDFKIEIVASDISHDILAKAKLGVYSQAEVNRGLPAPYLVKYFEKHGLDWQVKPDVRSSVRFIQLNLTKEWNQVPISDIVFLRNVLIYFDLPTKRKILDRMKQVLRPDGALFLGGAETTLNVHDGYERVPVNKTCYYALKR